MKKLLCSLLATTLVVSQFMGCASIPRLTKPAVIDEKEPSAVVSLSLDSLNYETFHAKVAEIKGKIQKFHDGDPLFIPLSLSIDSLDQTQNNYEIKNSKIRKRSALCGAIVSGALVVGYGLYGQSKEKDENGSAIGWMVSMAIIIASPIAALLGSGFGYIGAAIVRGSDISKIQKQNLQQLIDQYNILDEQRAKQTSNQ
jgi:hypothetical protein